MTFESRLSKRTTIFALFLLILICIVLRYPTTPHQLGADGYFNNAMAKFIMEDGYANWMLSPYSYMGLGPFSYPAAIHFLLATISGISGIPLEESVLYFNLVLGMCGVLFAFIMVKEMTKRDDIALLSSFFFSTSPEFLRLTIWNGSSRSLVMVFLLLAVYFLFKTQYAKRSDSHSSYFESTITFLTFLLFLMITTMHRMWVFALFIIISYLLARPLYAAKKMLIKHWGIWDIKKHLLLSSLFFTLWTCAIIVIIYAQLINFGVYGGMNLWFKYQRGQFFAGSSNAIVFANMLIDYWTGWGIISAFFILGVIALFWKRNKNYAIIFLLSSILFIAPIATLGLYSKLILIVFITPLVAIGILWFLRLKYMKKIFIPTLLVILIVASGFNLFMINHWESFAGGNNLKPSEYNIGLYVKQNLDENDTYISNNQVFGNQILFLADCKYFTEKFPYPLIYQWVEEDDIEKILDWEKMLKEQSIEITYPEPYRMTLLHRDIIMSHVDSSVYTRSRYNVNYAIDNIHKTTTYSIEPSLHDTRYLLFTNSVGQVWYLG